MSAASIPRIATESIGRIKADDKRLNRSHLDHMPTRCIKFVLLACIVCWGTGAAQFVHELVEHAEHDEPRRAPLPLSRNRARHFPTRRIDITTITMIVQPARCWRT